MRSLAPDARPQSGGGAGIRAVWTTRDRPGAKSASPDEISNLAKLILWHWCCVCHSRVLEGKEAMKLATILEAIRGNHPCATADDIRNVFGDYHNVLRWLAVFLIGDEKLADACIVDACTIAQTQTPIFHEWLVYWAARATLRCAFQRQHAAIAELVPEYEKGEPVEVELPPLSAGYFRLLIKNSEHIRARLDVLCRFALVIRGIAKDSYGEFAAQLGISRSAVERAYCIGFDTLNLAS
jgi:hypothetical protein